MRATVHAASLRSLAERCARVPSTRPYAPIYGATLLDAADGHLTGYATDGDTWLRDGTPATVEQAGRVAVSAKLLATLAAVLPKGVLELSSTGSALEITRPGTRDRWTLPGMHAEDFPSWPGEPSGQIATVPAAAMGRALDLVGGVAKYADPAIKGLRWLELTADGAGVSVRGTDRYRLAGATVEPETPVTGSALAVVAPELAGVLAPLAKEHDRVSIMFPDAADAAMLAISAGPVRVMTRLHDPAESDGVRSYLRRILASVWPGYFVAHRLELAEQVERASWSGEALVLDLAGSELTITTHSEDDNRGSNQTMTVDVPPDSHLADGMRAAVKGRHLLDALKAHDCERVRIAVDKPAKVGVYTVADAADASPIRYGMAAFRVPSAAQKAA